MKLIKIIVTACSALILANCASGPSKSYQMDKDYSQANNYLRAARVRVIKDTEIKGKVDMLDTQSTLGGSALYGMLTRSATLGALNFFGGSDSPAKYSRIFGWVDATKYNDEEIDKGKPYIDISNKFNEALIEAMNENPNLLSHFGDYKQIKGTTWLSGEKCNMYGIKYGTKEYKAITGDKAVCHVGLFAGDDVSRFSGYHSEVFLEKCPSFLDKKGNCLNVYSFKGYLKIKEHVVKIDFKDKFLGKRMNVVLTYDLYKKVSAKLPKNIFIYISPGNQLTMTKGGMKKVSVPVVLNQGKEHFFIKPNS